jgi:hypothetical protein
VGSDHIVSRRIGGYPKARLPCTRSRIRSTSLLCGEIAISTSAKNIRGNLPKCARKVAASDLLAALSVAAVEVPTAMAYPKPAGFSAIIGIYLSILPLLAYAFLGYSRRTPDLQPRATSRTTSFLPPLFDVSSSCGRRSLLPLVLVRL